MKKNISIGVVLILILWAGYCFGYYIALTANEKRKASLAYSNAKIALSILKDNNEGKYIEANNKLGGSIEISLLYVDAAKKDIESLSLFGFIFRPDIVVKSFLWDRNEPFIDDDELNSLKVDFDEISKEVKSH